MKFLRAFIFLSVVLASIFTTSALAQRERILHFDSRIVVETSGSLTVTETIQVQVGGNQIQHGIYRDFPQIYGGRFGLKAKTGFKVVLVRCDGREEDFHFGKRENGTRVYIGSASVFVTPGVHTYELIYETDRQLGFFSDHDELYWNVTGNGWAFPIEKATATVVLPDGVTPGKLEAYTGPQGARGKSFSAELKDGKAVFETTQTLPPYEGLTIVVAWPKGFVKAPTLFSKFIGVIRANVPVFVGLLGVLCLLAYYLAMWKAVGKDPKSGVIIPLYAPPKNFSPAAVRYLLKMGFDNRAFTAAILNLAVKGKIKIQQIERGSFVLVRLDKGRDNLLSEEQNLLKDLFPYGESLLGLKQENHEIIGRARNGLEMDLAAAEKKTYFVTNIRYWLPGLLFSLFVGAFLFYSAHTIFEGSEIIWLVGIGVVGVLVNIIFLSLLKAPTLAGRKILDQIDGFKMYLSVAEKDRLNLENPPERTPQLFEKFLPYALALGVEQKWSEQFADVLAAATLNGTAYSPMWYAGNSWTSFQTNSFACSLGDSLSGAIASAATAPGSSSGFSSGGGGGGSSGGGGGGGGGGGW